MTENWGTYKNKRLTDHLECFESWSKLKTFTAQKLKDKGASWYTQCSSGKDTIYTGMFRREGERHERDLARPNKTRQKIPNVAPEKILLLAANKI